MMSPTSTVRREWWRRWKRARRVQKAGARDVPAAAVAIATAIVVDVAVEVRVVDPVADREVTVVDIPAVAADAVEDNLVLELRRAANAALCFWICVADDPPPRSG